MVKVSVIIVNTNGMRFIGSCLSSVYYSKKVFDDFEVILVDNSSSDGSLEYVRANFPDIKILENKENLGFAKSNNRGIMVSRGDYFILLNGDTIVTPTWLLELLRATEGDPKIGIVGPKTLKFDRHTIDTTGHIFNFKLGDARNRGSGEIDRGQYDSQTDVFGVQFSCVLIRREVIKNVGLLDEEIFLSIEDVDYCVRTRLLGWKIFYCPSSIIYHYGGGFTPMGKTWHNRKLGVAYRLRLILKNYNTHNALKWGLYGVVFDLKAIMTSIMNRTWDLLLCYSFALWWNLFHLPIKERIEVQKKRVLDDEIVFTLRYTHG